MTKKLNSEDCPTCGRSMGKNIILDKVSDDKIIIKGKKLDLLWCGSNIIVWSDLDD